jgi:hypothetical protein
MKPPSRFKIFLVFGPQTPEHLMRWNEPDELARVTNGSEGSTTGTARHCLLHRSCKGNRLGGSFRQLMQGAIRRWLLIRIAYSRILVIEVPKHTA